MNIRNEHTLNRFRSKCRCEVCGCFPPALNVHHLWGKGMGGGSQIDLPINLIALCPTCHNKVHSAHVKRSALLVIVAQREHTTPEAIEEIIWALRRKRKR